MLLNTSTGITLAKKIDKMGMRVRSKTKEKRSKTKPLKIYATHATQHNLHSRLNLGSFDLALGLSAV